MTRWLTHTLAIILACSTGLAGVPLITALGIPDPQAGAVLSPQPFDLEQAAECPGEQIEEEREEEQADDTALELFVRPAVVVVSDRSGRGLAVRAAFQAAAGFRDAAHSIRGPPAG
jgi:hypothetical protein